MIIKIKNLSLKTIIGTNDWEREEKQEVIINIQIEFDSKKVSATDHLEGSVDYKILNKKIISFIESSHFHTLEKLSSSVLNLVMEDKKILKAKVEVDKPHSLKHTDSVSAECEAEQKH